jgi:hypothetical protein
VQSSSASERKEEERKRHLACETTSTAGAVREQSWNTGGNAEKKLP